MPGVEKEKDEESEKFVHAVVTVKVSHLSLFLRLLLAMILPRVIRRVSYSCWCGLCGSVGLWLWVRAVFERGGGCGGNEDPSLPIFRI